jgi:hypothetical protein
MILISHRGNTDGKNIEKENTPSYINSALDKGYNVEIDIWMIHNKWYLGHDEPQIEINYEFLTIDSLWIHAKNGAALYNLLQDKKCNVFYHTDEDWVLTSKQYIWTYPNKFLYPNSICVMPELGYNGTIENCAGICSDFISRYEKDKRVTNHTS